MWLGSVWWVGGGGVCVCVRVHMVAGVCDYRVCVCVCAHERGRALCVVPVVGRRPCVAASESRDPDTYAPRELGTSRRCNLESSRLCSRTTSTPRDLDTSSHRNLEPSEPRDPEAS